MIKKLAAYAFFIFCIGPILPRPAAAFTPVTTPNKYMVENTSGTSPSGQVCYDFITRPTCSSFISGISSSSIPSGSTQYIQNSATPTTNNQVFNVSSGTATQAFVSTITVQNPALFNQVLAANAQGVIVSTTIAVSSAFQPAVQFSTNTQFVTTSNVFQSTNLAATITPTASSHRVQITISGDIFTTAGGTANAILSVKRGSTDLSIGGIGFALSSGNASSLYANAGITYIDSPATTSATTYTATLRNTDNTTTVRFGNAVTQVMTLTEIP